MKRYPAIGLFTGTFAVLFALAAPVSAQNPVTPNTAAPPTPAGEAIVLSPFEVTTDRDTGFAAASSLAGGRLAGELRDTPVAYSVMT
ncbi:MAG: hypothetical protein ACREH8_24260, partial [Opitutaceae bacterium]